MFSSLSTKITVVVFAISLILALGSASLQLHREYLADIGRVQNSLDQIKTSYLAPLEASAFALDIHLLQTHLEGIGRLPGIHCARIELDKGEKQETYENNDCKDIQQFHQVHFLQTTVSGAMFQLGTLTIHYSHNLAWENLQKRLLFVLGINVLQTFLAALIILGILHFVVSRPLAILRKQLEANSSDNSRFEFPPNRWRGQPDELDLLAQALNDRQRTIGLLVQNLQETNQDLANLLNVVSHDLRTPMVNLSGYSQESILLIQEQDQAQPISEEHYKQLVSHLLRIRQNSELFHAQLVALGKYLRVLDQPMAIKRQSIPEVWKMTCSQFSLELAQTSAVIRTEFNAEFCFADRDALLIILGRILENSLKFRSPLKSPEIDIHSFRTTEGKVCIQIEDKGIGITPAETKLIFNLFYRSTNKNEGVGMGLPIALKLAKRMNGVMEAERREPEGLRLNIFLPASE